MSRQQVYTKRCRVGFCSGPVALNSPAFIPDDAPFGACQGCLQQLLKLESSYSCSCCGAGEDSSTNGSIYEAVKRLAAGEPIVPKYVCRIWSSGQVMDLAWTQHIGIFCTDDDPVDRKPVEEVVVKPNHSWITPYHRLEKKAAEMSAAERTT